jgi:hypothetical protein
VISKVKDTSFSINFANDGIRSDLIRENVSVFIGEHLDNREPLPL